MSHLSRAGLARLVALPIFERVIMVLIVVNAITLGLETSQRTMDAVGPILIVLDRAILAVFVAEIAVRIVAHGGQFFRNPWSLFDVAVVSIALIPATGGLSVLRALRILRALRLVSTVQSMRRVVSGLLTALPGMGSILALLALIFYVFSVMATKLYGASFPEWFGTIGGSAYSLFQIMTLESWSMGIVRPVMASHPLAWAFFIPFILMTSFTVLNLFIGVIVDAMQRLHDAELAEEREAQHVEAETMLAEIRALAGEVREIRTALQMSNNEASPNA